MDVVAGDDVDPGLIPEGGVVASGGVGGQRGDTNCDVVAPDGVMVERAYTNGCIVVPVGVIQRRGTGGRVVGSRDVGRQRRGTIGRVGVPAIVCRKCKTPNGGVTAPCRIRVQRALRNLSRTLRRQPAYFIELFPLNLVGRIQACVAG